MARLRILICGGGIAGPALAFWLAHHHDVTIVERCSALRASGAQIDLREQGIDVVKRMGLLDRVREKRVEEDGVALVDSSNRRWAVFMANTSGRGVQSMTSEYEIMRGDLVRVLYDATKDSVNYVFGKTVDSYKQDDDGVTAFFSDGTSDRYDILVGADGQNSGIRKQMLPPSSPDPLRRFGAYMAYWFVPRDRTDSSIRRSYAAADRRLVMTRSHSPTTSQAYLIFQDNDPGLVNLHKKGPDEKKIIFERKFADAGWQTERLLRGMKDDEVYFQEVVQVRLEKWHDRRVVLLADAAHCASPLSGMGTTGAFVGSYVLAGEIFAHSNDIPAVMASYEQRLRPFVSEIQKSTFPLLKYGMPSQQWVVWLMRFVFAVACFLRLPDLIFRLRTAEKGGWELPSYSFGQASETTHNLQFPRP